MNLQLSGTFSKLYDSVQSSVQSRERLGPFGLVWKEEKMWKEKLNHELFLSFRLSDNQFVCEELVELAYKVTIMTLKNFISILNRKCFIFYR